MNTQWKSLDELGGESVNSFGDREFSEGASELQEGVSRRSFLKYLGGAAALAGLTGCDFRKPHQKIRPYAKKVEHVVPGNPIFYATSIQVQSDVLGALVETHEGRPTKIEGNPEYGTGASTAFHQASVLGLYDPDRLKMPLESTKKTSVRQFEDWMLDKRKQFRATGGDGVAVLMPTQLSPAFHRELSQLLEKCPNANIYRYDTTGDDRQIQALKSLTGQLVKPVYDFSRADRVVSFSADFLGSVFQQTSYVGDFSSRRDPEDKDKPLNRLYQIEERVSVTGTKADHRFPVKRSEQLAVLLRLLDFVSKKVNFSLKSTLDLHIKSVDLDFIDDDVLSVIADDLVKHRSRSLVIVSDDHDEFMHQLVFLLNSILGNNFKTIDYHSIPFSEHDYSEQSSDAAIMALTQQLNDQKVDTLFILGGNPAYSVSDSLGFSQALVKAVDRVYLTDAVNETSRLCNWVLPQLHFLETWGDVNSIVGVTSLVQPVIKRSVDGYSDLELLHLITGTYVSDYSLLRRQWKFVSGALWKKALHNGVLFKSDSRVYPRITTRLSLSEYAIKTASLEVSAYLDYKVLDGRFSNSTWLQELSDPISKLTWDNALYIAPRTASELSLKTGDMVRLQAGKGISIELPIFVSPGQAPGSLSVSLGYGKQSDNKVESGVGVDVTALLQPGQSYLSEVTVIKTGETYELATTQDHGFMEGRPHFRYASVADYKSHPHFAKEQVEVPIDQSLWADHDYSTGYQWGMVIDLGKCTSCNACITSCQAENNIPVVGKEEVLNGREMQWMRLDRYYEGDVDNPKIVEQPLTCLHCENAPCEQVCPVAATVHDEEGLNTMVYNRCVGTRYCSDNCPAKVRRFNFFDYHQRNPHSQKKERFHFFDYMKEPAESVKKQFNPDVTVRMRGVMEKCTYCVQRIKGATQRASNEDREITDGEVVTACQQACPANAITMGNILDPKSAVSKQRKQDRHYSILEQLLLKARTTYLAAIYNPNPRLETEVKEVEHGKHHG